MSKIADRAPAALLISLLAACDQTGGQIQRADEERAVAAPMATGRAEPAKEAAQPLGAFLQESFAQVIAREDGAGLPLTTLSADTDAGIGCTPQRISGNRRELQIALPQSLDRRRNVLAAITPERGLHIIYEPYGDDAEGADLVVPSVVLSWKAARYQARFALTTDEITALRKGAEEPFALFVEPGIYQIALVNAIDRDLLEENGTPFRVIAGCVIPWTP